MTAATQEGAGSAPGGRAGSRQPTIVAPHGGGPWPFVDLRGFNPERNIELMRAYLAIGRALARVRDENVLILGSGMSYRNLRLFKSDDARRISLAFDAWLKEAATAAPPTRVRVPLNWSSAPFSRQTHPREEHLLPLMVVTGATGEDPGRVTFDDDWDRAFNSSRCSATWQWSRRSAPIASRCRTKR
jgi:hypothetical protein